MNIIFSVSQSVSRLVLADFEGTSSQELDDYHATRSRIPALNWTHELCVSLLKLRWIVSIKVEFPVMIATEVELTSIFSRNQQPYLLSLVIVPLQPSLDFIFFIMTLIASFSTGRPIIFVTGSKERPFRADKAM